MDNKQHELIILENTQLQKRILELEEELEKANKFAIVFKGQVDKLNCKIRRIKEIVGILS